MPTQQQEYNDGQPPISQAVQIFAEGPEIVPYASKFKPPYPATLIANYSGYPAVTSVNGNGTGASASQVPDSYDLHWVAGDTAYFEIFFPGVCWVDVDPGTETPPVSWVDTEWQSQVRAKAYQYYGYWWPPTWPGYRFIMAFTVSASFEPTDYNGQGPGTVVSLVGGSIWPGSYVWDLQTKQWPDQVNDPDIYHVRTWKSGKATIDPQVTQDDIFPPSNWPVYPYV
jgi:hypothetical protein